MKLLSENISPDEKAPVIVMFTGGNIRRDQLIKMVKSIGEITIYGALSEDEGIDKIRQLPKVDLILISGRYTEGQRTRIREYLEKNKPLLQVKISEPGWEYPYKDENIITDIKKKLNIS